MDAQQPILTLFVVLLYQFITTKVVDVHKAEKEYMQNKCYDIMKLKEYYIRQKQLFYTINKDDKLLKRTFILNMLTLVAELV